MSELIWFPLLYIQKPLEIVYKYNKYDDAHSYVYIRYNNIIVPYDKLEVTRLSYNKFEIKYPTYYHDFIKTIDIFVENQNNFTYTLLLLTYLFETKTQNIYFIDKLHFKLFNIINNLNLQKLMHHKMYFTTMILSWPKLYSIPILAHFDNRMQLYY
jgi:hypothetical protein